MNTYGERLEHALQLSKRDRTALGKELGISIQAIGQVIAGKTKALTAENSARAARFLDVDHFWLATGEGAPMSHKARGAWPFGDVAQYESLSDEKKRELGQLVGAFLAGAAPEKRGAA